MENTQKTPEQWFQMLKEPYRSQAIANLVDNRPVLSLNSALECQNAWKLTQQGFEYWNKIAVSIKAGETTYFEPEKSEPIELHPEEPTDWKAMYNELKSNYELAKNDIEIEKDLREQWHNHYFKLKEEYNELKAKYDQLEPKGEKVYFYMDDNIGIKCGYLQTALDNSKNNNPIYEAYCIGKKKSVLVNE